MFDTLCALLLRLYPAGFRRAYGADAVQLIRDRARHERGIFLRTRLLIDLAVDLFATSRHGWQPAAPALARIDSGPHFDVIDIQGPRPEALAAGVLASILMFGVFALLFQAEPPAPAVELIGEGAGADVQGAPNDAPALAVAPDPKARHRVVAAIAATLRTRYFDRAAGGQLADALLTSDRNGEYEALGIGPDLADRLNADIQVASRARGIPGGQFVADVVYSAWPLPTGPPPPMTEEMRDRQRAALLAEHCLFETVESFPRNVGYLKVNGFADPAICGETARQAMASLDKADALIVDLRDNGGGLGETALQIAGYLFDRPAFMYDPRPNSPVPARTASPVPGNTLAGKPVYVLTSSLTQSAAEYLVYNLKMLKRATIVGERTAGHQHSGGFHRLTDHFGIGIQEVAPPANPYPVKGWEVIGVEPDVKVSRAEALTAARRLIDVAAAAR